MHTGRPVTIVWGAVEVTVPKETDLDMIKGGLVLPGLR